MKHADLIYLPLQEGDEEDHKAVVACEITVQDPCEYRQNASQSTERANWEYDETLAVIASIKEHFEELRHPVRKKLVWDEISRELQDQGIFFSSSACKMKWKSLVRTYKSSKQLRKKNGPPFTRFYFYDKMDELLGHEYSMNTSEADEDTFMPIIKTEAPSSERKRRYPAADDVLTLKRRYYEDKQKVARERYKFLMEIEREKLTVKQNKLKLMQEKNDIDRRRVVALEALVQIHKEQASK